MINVNGKLFFDGYAGTLDTELWQSDGTAAGTKLLKNIATDFRSSLPKSFFNFNGTLYFTAETNTGRELWRSDGTEAGTVQVMDIAPGIASAFTRYRDPEFVNVNGRCTFQPLILRAESNCGRHAGQPRQPPEFATFGQGPVAPPPTA